MTGSDEVVKLRLFHIKYGLDSLIQILRKNQRGYTTLEEKTMEDQPLQWIFARRSIRKFHVNPVEDEKIDQLLRAAMAAPSANNSKPWHFIVVRDRQILDQIADIHPYAKMCYEASLAIVVCANPAISERYWQQDCSAATQNILLAGTSLGLGTVWLGVHPRPEREEPLKKLFECPPNMEILSIVALGYPAEEKAPRTQYDASRVHDNKW
jgi:nitroreductase